MNMILFNEQEQFFFPTNDERAQHIIHILKKKPGDVFEAGIENAQAGQAKITAIDETGIYFDFEKTGDGKPANPIELIIGFVRPIQLKRIFRDIAGLGVQKVHLVATELGEKSYMNSKIAERGTAHAALRDGAMQAMSTHIPELVIHDCLEKCLNKLHTQDKLCMPVCLDTAQANISFTEYLLQKKYSEPITYCAAIGTERGWTNRERKLFEKNNFILCRMGNRILRTETAVTVATTLLLQHMGEL